MASGNQNTARNAIVSSESESLILVDAHGNELGYESKGRCHDGDGILHRAFSLFVFNNAGQLLLQQRSEQKRLWPGFWSNSCCSHPRRGETMTQAAQRRLLEELGLDCEFRFLYQFQYSARYLDLGSENELCSVYLGRTDVAPRVNPTEIAAFRYVSVAQLDAELHARPEQFTPWFMLEWPRVKEALRA